MKILKLHLNKKRWEEIKNGEESIELRPATEYWRNRLIGIHYDEIHLILGCPIKGDDPFVIKRKWSLVSKETVLHEEFGDKPVEVFVISINQKLSED